MLGVAVSVPEALWEREKLGEAGVNKLVSSRQAAAASWHRGWARPQLTGAQRSWQITPIGLPAAEPPPLGIV